MNAINYLGLDFNHWLEGLRTPSLNDAFMWISGWGVDYWAITLMAVLFWAFGARWAYRVGFSFFLSQAVTDAVKLTLCVKRPWLLDYTLTPVEDAKWHTGGSYSFPSGHSSNAAAVLGSLAFKIRRVGGYVVAGILIALMGLSRLYLGVHSPMDVMCGILLGLMAVCVVEKLLSWIDGNDVRRWMVVAVGLAATCAVWYFLTHKAYPEGHETWISRYGLGSLVAFGGFLVCWGIERQWIVFNPSDYAVPYRVAGVILGLIGLYFVREMPYRYLAMVFTRETAGHLMRALPMVWIFVVWPALMKPLEKSESAG